jgi:hypothetical protein
LFPVLLILLGILAAALLVLQVRAAGAELVAARLFNDVAQDTRLLDL